MRLASYFLSPRARRTVPPAPARIPVASIAPGPAPTPADALDWVTRRAAARQDEWRDVIAAIEAAWHRSGGDDRLAARRYADMERRGEIVRRYASPTLRPEGIALWWLRVGRRPATRRGLRPEPCQTSEPACGAGRV